MTATAANPTSAARAPVRRWWSGLFWKCLLSMLVACWVSTGLLAVLGLYLTRIEVRDDMAPPKLESGMRRELQRFGPMPALSSMPASQCEAMLQALVVRIVGMDTPNWMAKHSFAGGTHNRRIAIRYRDRDGGVCLYPSQPTAPLAQALEEAEHEAQTTHSVAPRRNDRDGDWVSVVALPLSDTPGAILSMGQHSGGSMSTFMRADSGDLEGLVIYLMVISAMAAVAVATLLTRRIRHAENAADTWAAGDLD
ncbi:MAG: hypothetical protein ACREP7_05675, partial [Lysobacter sp.]